MENYFYQRMWDFSTFKEMLTEKYQEDEIFFYLHLRNIIFGGPQINPNRLTQEVICFVQWEKLETILHAQKMSNSDLHELLLQLKKRVVIKQKKNMIDGYFVLRMLVEYYRQEKNVRIEILKDKFINLSESNKGKEDATLTFIEFRSFIRDNFGRIPKSLHLALYRLGWSLGNGCFRFDCFIASANFYKIFIYDINLISSLYLNIQDNVGLREEYKEETEIINSFFSGNQKKIFQMQETMSHRGVEQLDGLTDIFNIKGWCDNVLGSRCFILHQGDSLNMFVELFSAILKSIVINKSLYLENYKFGGLRTDLPRIESLRGKVVFSILSFLERFNFEIFPGKISSLGHKQKVAIEKIQRLYRKIKYKRLLKSIKATGIIVPKPTF